MNSRKEKLSENTYLDDQSQTGLSSSIGAQVLSPPFSSDHFGIFPFSALEMWKIILRSVGDKDSDWTRALLDVGVASLLLLLLMMALNEMPLPMAQSWPGEVKSRCEKQKHVARVIC